MRQPVLLSFCPGFDVQVLPPATRGQLTYFTLCVFSCLQESPGPTSCPLVFGLQSSALVPLGVSTSVVLRGRNLDVYTVRLSCVFCGYGHCVIISRLVTLVNQLILPVQTGSPPVQ